MFEGSGLELTDFVCVRVCVCMFYSEGHIAMVSLCVEGLVHTNWSRFCTVNHWVSVNNYQHSGMEITVKDSNRRPQRLKAGTLKRPHLSNPRSQR